MGDGFTVIVQKHGAFDSPMYGNIAPVELIAFAPDEAMAFQHVERTRHCWLRQIERLRQLTHAMGSGPHENRQQQGELARGQISRSAAHRVGRDTSHHLKRYHRL
tara:strand:+ start:28509 stop:28823 length:315 start_codon:yes stop_codon:yes gene_type:complete